MPSTRFDMPTTFGPSLIPDQSPVADARSATISFETTQAAAARLLPRHFKVAPTPTITVSRIDYGSVEYLGGRGYGEVVISVAATHESEHGILHASYPPVMWVSEVGALVAGREFMGFAKLFAGIPAMEASDKALRFSCSEYDAPLLEGSVSDMQPLSEEKLAKVAQRAACVETFGHKYIPGPHGTVDADYALVNVMRWDYARAWTGRGEVKFHRPSQAAAPLSSRVMHMLADLPILGYGRAFVGQGSALIDRKATRRI